MGERSHEMRYLGKAYRVFTLMKERERPGFYTVRVGWTNEGGMEVAEYLRKFQNRLTLLAELTNEKWYHHLTPEEVRAKLLAWRKRAEKAGFTNVEKWRDNS